MPSPPPLHHPDDGDTPQSFELRSTRHKLSFSGPSSSSSRHILQQTPPSPGISAPDTFLLSSDDDDDDPGDGERLLRHDKPAHTHTPALRPPWWARILFLSPPRRRRPRLNRYRYFRSTRRRCCQAFLFATTTALVLLIFTAIFRPSYTRQQYPAAWAPLESSIRHGGGETPATYWRLPPGEAGTKTTATGRGNPNNERIFIAANIVNAKLIDQEWGWRVMELMDLLGPENVFLSVFENDSGPDTTRALKLLSQRITEHMPAAGQSIVSTTLPFSGVPRVRLPNGETHIKRITYLAEVRNRALLPLIGNIPSLSRWNQTGHPPLPPTPPAIDPMWELLPLLPESDRSRKPALPTSWVPNPHLTSRVLFLNDVVFSPRELMHLLFSTRGGNYSAACGIDYINPFKYYDTFATRDPDGYPLGVPFFPYFATPGPRAQILNTNPEINVSSCWGGVVAFNASVFTRTSPSPIRFRAEKEPYWDASECCLVHADIADPTHTFINPFIRCAYDRSTFDWLPFVRRVERTFSAPHRLVVWALGMPWAGTRRGEVEGAVVEERIWDGVGWMDGKRVVGKGGWCGGGKLLVMNEEYKKGGEGRKWMNLPVPVEKGG